MRSRTAKLAGLVATVTVATALALTLPAAAESPPAPGPGSGAVKAPEPKGCAEQCITKAWLTGKAPELRLEVTTKVPARIRVEASTELPMKTAAGPKFAAVAASASTGNALKSSWTADFGPVKAATKYHIVAWATDKAGKVAYQQGTFTTPAAAPAKDQAAGGGSVKTPGEGCQLQCISKAWLNPTRNGAGLEVTTKVPSRMQVKASKFEPMQTTSGPHFNVVHAAASSGGEYRTEWNTSLADLDPGTKYHIVVWAMDEKGKTAYQQGTFSTHEAHRRVTVAFNRVHVISDGDTVGRGDLELFFGINGEWQSHLHQGMKKVKSGSTYGLPWDGSRPGTMLVALDDAPQWLNLKVRGVETDYPFKFCSNGTGPGSWDETGGESDCVDFATATISFDIDAQTWSGVRKVVFETTAHHVKFQIETFITVDYV